jgi:hypothetical protein
MMKMMRKGRVIVAWRVEIVQMRMMTPHSFTNYNENKETYDGELMEW